MLVAAIDKREKLAYSVDEVSEQTSISKSYLRNAIRDGRLKVSRIGRRVIIRHDALEEFLKQGEQQNEK